ncbi:MAG: glucosaminidase domain-containing protein [Bacteroidales bacterium]|nr:glucosaminidase domain-containing protein [Bacteroidales bacterium]
MKKFFAFGILLLCGLYAQTQVKNNVTEEYIIRYKDIALENERQYGVPASITLAQGIIESGSGRSTLAKEGNNHFGIKCHGTWNGERMYKDDDKKDDCFRVYANAEESFTDHSVFLSKGRRYSFLFDLDKSDYKAWAEGLKQAGYATNPQYAELLINIIEVYDLDKLTDKDFYLAQNTVTVQEDGKTETSVIENTDNGTEDTTPEVKTKKSLLQRVFGNTKWYQRRHETAEQRQRRLMDEKIRRMMDEQDVQRSDFEVEFE